jgi:hypothetical protein
MAHESNQAFFEIYTIDTKTIVLAEFPWSIRNAVLTFNPKLNSTVKKEVFFDSFLEYVNSTLILVDDNGKKINLIEVIKVPQRGHSHQNNYKFIYDGVNTSKITNSLMFNINKEQTNHHILYRDDNKVSFKTNKSASIYKFSSKNNTPYFWLLLLLLLIPTGYILYNQTIKR